MYNSIFFQDIKVTSQTHIFDLLTNIFINDFYLSNFYFIWTQFFILPLLLLTIHLKHNLVSLKSKNSLIVITYVLLLYTLLWSVREYYVLNQYVFHTKNTQYFFNNLLINPLNKYHPILFFSAYIFIFNSLLYSNPSTNWRFSPVTNVGSTLLNEFNVKNNFFWPLLSFSLFLGAWWALQEGSWGGWWNWDASEVFGLLILTYLLILLHRKSLYTVLTINLSINTITISSIVVVYCLLQLSYTLVSHNFGLNLIGYGYVQLTFLNTLILSILLYMFTVINTWYITTKAFWIKNLILKFFTKTTVKFSYNLTKLLITLLITLLCYIYVSSFTPILNNIFWKSFTLETLNKTPIILNSKLITIILLLTIVMGYNSLILLLLLLQYSQLQYYSLFCTFLYVSHSTVNKYFHILLVLLLTLPITLQYILMSYWELNTPVVNWLNTYWRLLVRNSFFLENTDIYLLTSTLSNLSYCTPTSFFSFSHNLNTQFFALNLSENLLHQTIYNHTYLYLFSVTVSDNPSLVTDMCILLILLFIFVISRAKVKIVL